MILLQRTWFMIGGCIDETVALPTGWVCMMMCCVERCGVHGLWLNSSASRALVNGFAIGAAHGYVFGTIRVMISDGCDDITGRG